jgi:hypothetical protein
MRELVFKKVRVDLPIKVSTKGQKPVEITTRKTTKIDGVKYKKVMRLIVDITLKSTKWIDLTSIFENESDNRGISLINFLHMLSEQIQPDIVNSYEERGINISKDNKIITANLNRNRLLSSPKQYYIKAVTYLYERV